MSKGLIQSAVNGRGQYASKTYVFKDDRYVRYDWTKDAVDSGYPQPLSAWGFADGFAAGIDAALNGGGAYAGKAYFFRGDRYIRYDWASDAPEPGYPQPLTAWGLTDAFAAGIDAALEGAGPYANKAYFFKGNQYVRYDWVKDALDTGYPQPLSAWKLPGDFAAGIDAAVNGIGQYAGKGYFFRGNQYVRYDWTKDLVEPGYPKEIAGNWKGLAETLGGSGPPPTPPPSTAVPGHKRLSTGVWNNGTTFSVQGGQSMTFVLKNTNVLGTTITIKAQSAEVHSHIFLPMQTVQLQFSVFGNEPMGWTFVVSTQSDAFLVTWELWSTWVPGDPPNP